MALKGERSVMGEGQLWTTWADKNGFKSLESDEETDKVNKIESDAMNLRIEDMHVFGQCPTWDDFFLVVCDVCSYVIKPQAFKHHVELRHGSCEMAKGDIPVLSNSKAPTKNKQSSSSTSSSMPLVSSSKSSSGATSHKPTTPHKSHPKCASSPPNHMVNRKQQTPAEAKNKKNHTISPVVRVERMPASMMMIGSPGGGVPPPDKKLPSPQQPPPPLTNALGNMAKLLLTSNSSLLPIPPPKNLLVPPQAHHHHQPAGAALLTKKSPSESSSSTSVPGRSRKVPKEKKLVLCKDREYDPNKHCGVLAPETGKPCTRSLTCKSHNISLRRGVTGRKKDFDQLLADHKASPGGNKSLPPTPPAIPPPPSSAKSPDPPPPLLKPDPSLREKDQEVMRYKVVSGDPACVSHHPRPAALCSFGLRRLESGLLLLNRQWGLQRAALLAAPPPLKKLCVEEPAPPPPAENPKTTVIDTTTNNTAPSHPKAPSTLPPAAKKKKLVPNGAPPQLAATAPLNLSTGGRSSALPMFTAATAMAFPPTINAHHHHHRISRLQLSPPPSLELLNGHLFHHQSLLDLGAAWCTKPASLKSPQDHRQETLSPHVVSSPPLLNGLGPPHFLSNSHSSRSGTPSPDLVSGPQVVPSKGLSHVSPAAAAAGPVLAPAFYPQLIAAGGGQSALKLGTDSARRPHRTPHFLPS